MRSCAQGSHAFLLIILKPYKYISKPYKYVDHQRVHGCTERYPGKTYCKLKSGFQLPF